MYNQFLSALKAWLVASYQNSKIDQSV